MPEALELNSVTGVILYYFTRVVEELVFSSPDAGATKVLIYPFKVSIFLMIFLGIEWKDVQLFLKTLPAKL